MTTRPTVSIHNHPTVDRSSFNSHIYAQTKTTPSHVSMLRKTLDANPKLSTHIDTCENLLYDVAFTGDGDSNTSSSYINSSDHYDNTYTNTYDNPIQYLDRYSAKSADLIKTGVQYFDENFYDHARSDGRDDHDDDNDDDNHDDEYSQTVSQSTTPVFSYLENRNLAICACIISVLILILIGIGIFLLNKLIRPVIINTTVNNHYGVFNVSNTTTSNSFIRPNASTPLMMLLKQSAKELIITNARTLIKETTPMLCPSNRWGKLCEYACKPCGFGVCNSSNGQCICPPEIYGEFCDLWKINDKPSRGDMTR